MANSNQTNLKQHHRIITFSLIGIFASFLVLLSYYFHQNLLNSIINHTNRTIDYSALKDGNISSSQPLNIKSSNNQPRLKTILIWNSEQRVESVGEFGTGHQPFIDHGCPVSNCFIQVNESSEFWSRATANNSEVLKSFDAVVISGFLLDYLPDYERPLQQRFIWLTQESPGNENGFGNVDENPGKLDHIFNWTMSYRKNSDIYLPYGKVYPILNRTQKETELREERRLALVNKTDPIVSWMVSDCITKSLREEYVPLLQKHIQVDIYGDCGNLSCPRGNHWISFPECHEMIGRKYKFYLSFENSMCTDYVTEKFFSILEQDVVPVVLGAADYRSIAPEHSYIDALDFDSPEKLSEYLHLLDDNDELYLDYLEWKSHYRVEAGMVKMARQGFCDLCAKLNREDEPEKIYHSLVPEWSERAQCRKGWRSQSKQE